MHSKEMRRINRTKILCTFGPAIASVEKVKQLMAVGANAFRLNMSHGTHETHTQALQIIRQAEDEVGVHIPIIADIQGPKLRVGDLPDGVMSLANGHEVMVADESVWEYYKKPKNVIPVRYPQIARDVTRGDALLFDDGVLKVEVKESDGNIVKGVVVHGGVLKSRKGINVPNVKYSESIITQKDEADIAFAVRNKCDYIAMSFVRSAEEVRDVKKRIQRLGGDAWIISKIEKPEALANIDAIVQESQVIMIARGDLGVEIPAAQVPIVQKQIIDLCNKHSKPVITATQMLESMIHNPRPTRAEASDVANAVLDGTDVVMLSAETSVGAYPLETVNYMRTICYEAERTLVSQPRPQLPHITHHEQVDLLARAVATISQQADIRGIAALSLSGRTVRYLSSRRPVAPILAITDNDELSRKVNLFHNVRALQINHVGTTDEMIENIKRELVRQHYFTPDSSIIVTVGRPLSIKSTTNTISIENLGEHFVLPS